MSTTSKYVNQNKIYILQIYIEGDKNGEISSIIVLPLCSN